MKLDRIFVTKCTLDMSSVIVQSSEDLKKEIASLDFEILLVSQSDLTGVLSYHYQASHVSECSSLCPWSFQASLKAFSTKVREYKICLWSSHYLGDLLGLSHIVDDMENPSRFSEEILRCISSIYVTLSGRARTSSCLQAPPSSKTRSDSWNTCLGDSKEANAPRGVVIESLKLHLDDSCFNIY
ncbi:hypothetical protein Bca52824_013564 [Brassica carinata]|uniref:Uncharacterized protein n=1 Tax=Brassica carinata TaxID=52824 RepID=A0A8X7VZK6_BRACI|nr:hypothetical protein Bca52824_013564 [Brassica carinata]